MLGNKNVLLVLTTEVSKQISGPASKADSLSAALTVRCGLSQQVCCLSLAKDLTTDLTVLMNTKVLSLSASLVCCFENIVDQLHSFLFQSLQERI